MKNIVFIPNVKGTDEKRLAEVAYDLSVKSWKYWCEKNNCELVVMQDLIHDYDEMKITWQRYYALEMLENDGVEYDQVLMVDADTIPHPDCPNIFEFSDRKFCFVHKEGSYDWILRSIENYSKYFFGGYTFPWYHYFDSGMLIFNEKHRYFFQQIIKFFHDNRENLITAEKTWLAGTDQTPVNFLTHLLSIDYKILPYKFNMCDMNRKEILRDDLLFTKCGWIYQYNSIPENKDDKLTYYWMEKTYNHLWRNLNGNE